MGLPDQIIRYCPNHPVDLRWTENLLKRDAKVRGFKVLEFRQMNIGTDGTVIALAAICERGIDG
jgi:hypothetical protein